MSLVRIVTDSTADISPQIAEELDIGIVPNLVYLGDVTYRDWVDLIPPACYGVMAGGPGLPRTAQPLVSDFVDTYRRFLDGQRARTVISIHIAATLSGTVNAAWTATQMLPDPSRVEVIDSGQVSMGLGWAVIKAAEWARAGATPTQVRERLHALLPHLRVAAMVDDLDSLRRGGRISQIAAALGTVLQIKPVLTIGGGKVEVLEKVRTRSRAVSSLAGHVRNWGQLTELAVLHTGAEELAAYLAERLQDLVPEGRMRISPAGAALATHMGLGAVGVCALVAGAWSESAGLGWHD